MICTMAIRNVYMECLKNVTILLLLSMTENYENIHIEI